MAVHLPCTLCVLYVLCRGGKVAGEIRFSSVKPVGSDRIQFNGAMFVVPGAGGVFNASHRVERLRFGPALPDLETAANPLSGVAKLSEKGALCIPA